MSIDRLEATVHSCAYQYTVVFDSDGSGLVQHGHITEEHFDHDLDVAALIEEFEGDEAGLQSYLDSYFWDNINEGFSDPYLQDEPSLEAKPLIFRCGDREELDRLVNLIMTLEAPEKLEGREWILDILAETDEEDQFVSGHLRLSDNVRDLLDLALELNKPYGYYWEYTDYGRDRKNSYLKTAETISYDLSFCQELTPRDRMNAVKELREWLLENDQEPIEYGLEEEVQVS